MSDLLVEIRSDEMPLLFAEDRIRRLAGSLFEILTSLGAGPRRIRTGYSTRRLVLLFEGLPEHEPEREEWRLGPAVEAAREDDGTPTRELAAFAAEAGVDPEALEVRHTLAGERLGLRSTVPGRPVRELLVERLAQSFRELDPEPTIAWSASESGWIRPLRSLVVLLDDEVLPVRFGATEAGRETCAHPVLDPEPLRIDAAGSYLETLRGAGVEPLFKPRREALERALREAASRAGGRIEVGARVLDRLAGRCEGFSVVVGTLQPPADLPREVLDHALVERLGALPVREDGEPTAGIVRFLAVTEQTADEDRVRTLVEWSARAVVADVVFFLEADRRLTLAERARLLDEHPWSEVAGTWAEKQARVETLAEVLCAQTGVGEAVREATLQAARLLKVDRTTHLIAHLPELRGVVGGLHARREGYSEPVWRAIRDHYLPEDENGEGPASAEARILGIADRIDSLVGILGTESKAAGLRRREVRRLGRDALELLVGADLEVDLDLLLARAVLQWQNHFGEHPELIVDTARGFLQDRLRQLLGDQGHPADVIEAVLAVDSRDPVDVVRRARAVLAVRSEAGFRSLVVAAKRLFGMVADADDRVLEAGGQTEPAEIALREALDSITPDLDLAEQESRYEDLLRTLLGLVAPLERFLAEVHVMHEDPAVRGHRIALLQAVRRRFWRVARLKELADA